MVEQFHEELCKIADSSDIGQTADSENLIKMAKMLLIDGKSQEKLFNIQLQFEIIQKSFIFIFIFIIFM
jgi:hypothetical protein